MASCFLSIVGMFGLSFAEAVNHGQLPMLGFSRVPRFANTPSRGCLTAGIGTDRTDDFGELCNEAMRVRQISFVQAPCILRERFPPTPGHFDKSE